MCSQTLLWSIACIFMFIVTLVLNYVSTSGLINDTDQGELSDKYGLPITPPGWTFSIWGIIYIWQAAWLFYITYHAIKYRDELQSTLPFGKTFYISWILSCIFNGAWIILFAFEELTISALILISISIALYVNGYINHKYIGLAAQKRENPDAEHEFPMYILSKCCCCYVTGAYRILLLNGIAFYATWTSIAQCLNIAIFLTYVADVYVYTSSLIALTILTIVILVYWFLDFYRFRSWLIYTYSPYAVLLWALSAVSTNSEDGDLGLKGATRVWVYVLIVMVAIGTVCKIIMGICYKPDNQHDKLNGTSPQHMVQQYSGGVGTEV